MLYVMLKRPIRLIGLRMPSALQLNATSETGTILKQSFTAGRKEDVMTEKISRIDATLKKLADDKANGKSEPSMETSEEVFPLSSDLAGDINCPHCHGLGYLRRDLPLGHPVFGKLYICSCRHGQVSQQIHQRLFAISNLDNLQHLTFENFQSRGRIGLGPWQADSL